MGAPVMQWQIISREPDKHARFYASVFGWKIDDNNSLGYRTVDTGSQRGASGGFWPAPPEAASFVQLFVEVSDLAATVDSVVKHGGSVLIPPQTLPQGEQMAILRDPMGVTFGVTQKKT